ncbi:hypothetical protein BH09ACT6_BH09ACT6_00950 [soil metagenome]
MNDRIQSPTPVVDRGLAKRPRRVVVAGDLTIDWNLARTRTLLNGGTAWNAEDRTETYGGAGGAAVLARLIEEVGVTLADRGPAVEVTGPSVATESISPGDPRFHHAYAVWSQYPRRAGDRGHSIWRVEEFLGLDRSHRIQAPVEAGSPAASPAEADLVIVDDANLGFRDSPGLWPPSLGLTAEALADADPAAEAAAQSPWVILKMACPVADGMLWRNLLDRHAKRLIVVMTLSDLRLSEVNISRELSWERTAGDLARELIRHPTVNSLVRCAHVLVSLGTGGAVLLSRPAVVTDTPDRLEQPDCHVFFDPESIENSWAEQYPGTMIGYESCLAAGIARELLIEPDAPDVHRGVRRGLTAQRALHLAGYGNPDSQPGRAGLAFPAQAMATVLQQEPREFATARIEQPVRESWSILESRYPEGLEPVAEAVARDGAEMALTGVPLGRFGKLLTLDRGEIEGFRSIRALMREYDVEPAVRPLNIAVFGPPGAGKSFGVKAVAKSAVDGDRIENLTFNLSQMKDASDIIDALHQVRDAGLRGKLPFVLWDEFDADLAGRPFGWLRHFLAPMQDGAFQQGQILHPIGKAIFVFAGGTGSRLVEFAGNRSAEFRLAKGPDFVSRLKGHVDIVGPDPRGDDEETDPHFRIRRAILLRSMLLRDRPGLFTRNGRSARLEIDAGVLRAFLGVSSYRHGARSLETIVAMSTLHGVSRYERSALPAADQLDAHVDAREFLELVERYVPDGGLLERLAEAVHITYCAEMLGQGHAWAGSPEYLAGQPLLADFAGRRPATAALPALVDWADLPEHLREMNRDAARDLSEKLAVLGYVLCQDAPASVCAVVIDPHDPRVERLAKREHERWMRHQVKTGWRYGVVRDDARRLHPCLRPWEELPETERDKDRQIVLELPSIAESAGMTTARIDELGEVTIGVTGHRVLADPERVVAGIETALAHIAQAHPGRSLTVVSALAEGADRLAVGPALKRARSRLVAVLPVPKYDYLADFESPGSKDEFLRLLSGADEVVELPPAASGREEAYAAVGDAVLERADVLLAIWDGMDSQGQGGTGQVVARARARGLPIAWVHASNRVPGTMEAASPGSDQGRVTYENV